MRKERKNIGIDRIQLNTGQLEWLPENPRTWTQTDIDNTAASIQEDEDFLEERPLLVVPFGKEFICFAGNLRHEGCKALKMVSAPCVVHCPETVADFDTILRRAMKDNGQFGKTNWDAIYSSKWGSLPVEKWGLTPPSWKSEEEQQEPAGGSPDDFGTDFSLPDGDKEPFRQVSFQLLDEMAKILLLATKAAQFTDGFYEIAGDGEDVNTNGVAVYLIAKEWCDRKLQGFDDNGYERAKKAVEELRQYLRTSLEKSGRKAADVDNLLGTVGMSGHYFGSSQWMFPTREAYEKMKEIMPLNRDYLECKKIEMRFNMLETLKEYRYGKS